MPNDPLPPSHEPNLDSFVLRFVRTGEPVPGGSCPQTANMLSESREGVNWHGVVRHVQSNRERAFSRWADAVAFIREFVDVEEHSVSEHGLRGDEDEQG